MMKKLLHIIATPRGEESRTLKVSQKFIKVFLEKHNDWSVEEVNLFHEKIPSLTPRNVEGKYILLTGKELAGDLQDAWKEIVEQIERFLSADAYLISTPMWNFNIPYILKKYIDVIIQPQYLFRYTDRGPEGLIKNKKMIIVTSRGGEYISEEMKKLDFQEPYLRTIFGFVGITDIQFINAQPMDAMGLEIRKEKIEQALEIAEKMAGNFN